MRRLGRQQRCDMVASSICCSAILNSQFPSKMEAPALASPSTSQPEGKGEGEGEASHVSIEGHGLRVAGIMSIHTALPSDSIKAHTKLRRKLGNRVFCWAAVSPLQYFTTLKEEESGYQRKAIIPCRGLHLWPPT